jgi:hypothetical protein
VELEKFAKSVKRELVVQTDNRLHTRWDWDEVRRLMLVMADERLLGCGLIVRATVHAVLHRADSCEAQPGACWRRGIKHDAAVADGLVWVLIIRKLTAVLMPIHPSARQPLYLRRPWSECTSGVQAALLLG